MTTPFLFFRGSLTREDCIVVLERAVKQLVISESLRPLLLCGAPDTILSCRLTLELLITWPAGERRGGAVLLLIQLEENCDGISLHRAHFSTPLFVQRSHYTLAQQSAVTQIVSITDSNTLSCASTDGPPGIIFEPTASPIRQVSGDIAVALFDWNFRQ